MSIDAICQDQSVRQLIDAYDEIDRHKKSIKKLNRFIIERGLGEEYIAWIIANRITTGDENGTVSR